MEATASAGGGASRPGRAAMGPGVALESLGGDVVDERLDMFREFVNSLDVEPGSSGETGGSTGPGDPGRGPREG